jgi:hypothetical protein
LLPSRFTPFFAITSNSIRIKTPAARFHNKAFRRDKFMQGPNSGRIVTK